MEWINTFQVKEKEIKLIEDRANYFQWKAKEEKRHGK
jgi:3-phenylpropionate/cinnamic acid dioxygenase small subunit